MKLKEKKEVGKIFGIIIEKDKEGNGFNKVE
jgi:hypothetical protein